MTTLASFATRSPIKTRHWALAMVWRFILACLLAWGLRWLWQQLQQAPARQTVTHIELRLQPGEAAVLGRRELAAPAAADQHVQFARDGRGAWGVRNVSTHHALEAHVGGQDQLLRSWPLEVDQAVQLGHETWRVDGEGSALVLQALGAGRRWHFDGSTVQELTPTGRVAQPSCLGSSLASRMRQHWNRSVPSWLGRPSRLTWGGEAECGNRVPATGLPTDSAWVQRDHGRYWLTANPSAARQICFEAPVEAGRMTPSARSVDCRASGSLFEQQILVGNVDRIVVGRTHFAVQGDGDVLRLTPLVRAGLLPMDAKPPRVDIMKSALVSAVPGGTATLGSETGQAAEGSANTESGLFWRTQVDDAARWGLPVAPWTMALGGALFVPMVGFLALRYRWASRPGTALALGVGLAGLMGSALAFKLGGTLGTSWSLAWVSAALAAVVVMPCRTGWAWATQALMALLLMSGLALQLQLGLQGNDVNGWTHFQKTSAAGAGAIWLSFLVTALVNGLSQKESRLDLPSLAMLDTWVVLVPTTVALALLALQVLFGSEEGVWGIQPVEFAMLALLLLGAHALALRQEWGEGGWRQWRLWWRVTQPVGLFVAIVSLALLLLNDYSPLLLIGGWMLGMLAAWCVGGRSLLAGLALALGVAAAAALYLWVAGEGNLWLQEHGFYGARFAVWLDAAHHPHSGEQVTRALQVLGRGQWWGDANAPAWRVPAVQDDMAPAFFTGRFGLAWAMALMAVQAAFVVALLMLGWRARDAAGPGDHRRRWALNVVFFAAWGAGALFASHLALSWGTNTGGLPVMGQPMPLLSSGSSVIWMLLAPLQALWMFQPALVRGAVDGALPSVR